MECFETGFECCVFCYLQGAGANEISFQGPVSVCLHAPSRSLQSTGHSAYTQQDQDRSFTDSIKDVVQSPKAGSELDKRVGECGKEEQKMHVRRSPAESNHLSRNSGIENWNGFIQERAHTLICHILSKLHLDFILFFFRILEFLSTMSSTTASPGKRSPP